MEAKYCTGNDLRQFLPPPELWPEILDPGVLDDLPERFNLAEELLDLHLKQGRGEKTAVFYEDRRISYREMAQEVNRLGSAFLDMGLRSRDRVGIRMTNLPETLVANFAILKIGAIPVPISPLWSRKEIAFVAEDSQLKALIVNASLLDEVRMAEMGLTSVEAIVVVDDQNGSEVPSGIRYHSYRDVVLRGGDKLEAMRLKPDEVVILLYTSGTTGLPKGCAHSLFGVLTACRLVTTHVWDMAEGDVLAGSAPISFAAGYGPFALISWTSPGAISLLPKFSPEALLENVSRHRVTILTGIPTAYRKMLQVEHLDRYDLTSLRMCTVGGDALGKETYNAWLAATGLPVWENMGTTELFNIIASNRLGKEPRPGSVGLPLPGYRVRVVDDQWNPCPVGQVGSLWLKGQLGIFYWNPRGNQGRLMKAQKENVRDGWNRVGDAVFQDEDGYIHFVSREDDMIKSSGYRLSPLEIEEVLNAHPLIKEAAVVGVPDRLKGQIVKAFIVSEQEVSSRKDLEEEIKAYCREHMAVFKIPQLFSFVSALPRTLTGKVSRKALK